MPVDTYHRWVEAGFVNVCDTCRVWTEACADRAELDAWLARHVGHDTYATGAVGPACGYLVKIRNGYVHEHAAARQLTMF